MNSNSESIQARMDSLEEQLATVKQSHRIALRRLRILGGLTLSALLLALVVCASPTSTAQGYGVTLAQLLTRVIALETKTQYMSADATAKSTTFSGCNVIVNDGGGDNSVLVTNSAGEGVGNLIIGYNNRGRPDGDVRTGSHNLILGDFENYTHFGGIIAGYNNAGYGNNAMVIGGNSSQAAGDLSCILGGGGSYAGGHNSVICGGNGNAAYGANAFASGGNSNVAQANLSSVNGGFRNVAYGDTSTVSGGHDVQEGDYIGWAAGNYRTP